MSISRPLTPDELKTLRRFRKDARDVARNNPVPGWNMVFVEPRGRSYQGLFELGLVEKTPSGYYHPAPQPEVAVVLHGLGTQHFEPQDVLATVRLSWGYQLYTVARASVAPDTTEYSWPWAEIREVREALS